LLLGSTLAVAGCSTEKGSDTEARSVASSASTARGVYVLEKAVGDILVLSFASADRYWSWSNSEACRDLTVLRDSCEESGRYVVDAGRLTLTPDAGVSRSYAFAIVPEEPTTLGPQADDPPLVGSGQQLAAAPPPAATSLSIAGQAMALVERGVTLLTTCEARAEGSGAIPGAASPSANYADGLFSSGRFAPGGPYDPRTVASGPQTLLRSTSATDHDYALLSDRLPAGTTFEEANAALQRFNGPTGPALSGQGDDPSATAGWVVDPLTGELPVGCVTFERGNGWARNTTQAVHPFVGTITRYVVDGGDGTYRILTVGEGVTPPESQGDTWGDWFLRGGQELISGARNLGNVLGGPAIFRQLDRRLIESVHPQNPPAN
jgi:hypothetical protein